jgi:hypothetical protein
MKFDGQMSSQSPVVWWYREVNCEVVGMCVEAVPVLGAGCVTGEYQGRRVRKFSSEDGSCRFFRNYLRCTRLQDVVFQKIRVLTVLETSNFADI